MSEKTREFICTKYQIFNQRIKQCSPQIYKKKNNHCIVFFSPTIDHAYYIDCALEWSVMIILSLFPIFSQLITACATEEGFVYILHNQQLMG